jgi:two-component system CheB/CheR fusion protein
MTTQLTLTQEVPDVVALKWQEIADLLAESLIVPAALIMRTELDTLEVFISSKSDNNPYKAGSKEKWKGFYCESVIMSQKQLIVPDARKDALWDHNPDLELNLVSYFGVPVNYPNGTPFGTICVLDSKEHFYSPLEEKLMQHLKKIIELDLAFLYSYDITTNEQHDPIAYSENRFRALYVNMNEGAALHTLIFDDKSLPIDYKIIDINPAYENTLGITRESAINKLSTELYKTNEPPYLEIYSKVALTGNPYAFESYFEKMGKYFSISVYSPQTNSFATIFRDITDEKLAETALRNNEYELKKVQEITQTGSFYIDLQSKAVKWSEELYKIFGIDPSEPVPLLTESGKLFAPESWGKVSKAITHTARTGETFELEAITIKALNTLGWIWARGEAVRDDSGKITHIWGAVQDITDRKNTELILQNNEQKLLEINAAKDKLFSIIAHDLKGPIANIKQISNFVNDPEMELSEEDKMNYLLMLENTSTNLLTLLETLLEWSLSQIGGIRYNPSTFNLLELSKQVIDQLRAQAHLKNISIHNKIAPQIELLADPNLLKTILRNLISNAIKYSESGGSIQLSLIEDQNNTRIALKDNGIGMSQSQIDNLFKMSVNNSTKGTNNEKGTGLGLYLCKEFMDKHQGRIEIESTLGVGSTFHLIFPKQIG